MMSRTRLALVLALVGALTLSATTMAANANGKKGEKAGRISNDPTADSDTNLLLRKNTLLRRSRDGIGIEVRLMTPEAGAYTYPETIPEERQAQPEIFTGWAFVFNYPENCVSFPGTAFPCGPEDFNDLARGGVYNFSGFMNSLSQSSGGEIVANAATDGYVVLNGDITVGQAQRPDLPPGATTFPLENPIGAEVHVAIAPHGQFDATTIAEELYDPTGNPACGCWWVATFAGKS